MNYSRPRLIHFQPNDGAGLCAVGSTIQTCNAGGSLQIGDCSTGHNACGIKCDFGSVPYGGSCGNGNRAEMATFCINGNNNTEIGTCQNGNLALGAGNCNSGNSNVVGGLNRLYHGPRGQIR